jgi:hypothetical protein
VQNAIFPFFHEFSKIFVRANDFFKNRLKIGKNGLFLGYFGLFLAIFGVFLKTKKSRNTINIYYKNIFI